MIVASKYLPLILALALSERGLANDYTPNNLRGPNRRLPGNGNGNGVGNGNGSGALKKLDAEGCTVLEKANLCPPLTKDGEPLPCDDDTVSLSLSLVAVCKQQSNQHGAF